MCWQFSSSLFFGFIYATFWLSRNVYILHCYICRSFSLWSQGFMLCIESLSCSAGFLRVSFNFHLFIYFVYIFDPSGIYFYIRNKVRVLLSPPLPNGFPTYSHRFFNNPPFLRQFNLSSQLQSLSYVSGLFLDCQSFSLQVQALTVCSDIQ